MRMESSALPDPLESVCSNRSRATVAYYGGEKRDVERTVKRLFRRCLHAHEYAGLAGAPDDAQVEVGTLGDGLYLEMRDPVHGIYHAVQFVRPAGAGLAVVIDAICVHRTVRRMGLGFSVFARQLAAASALGIPRIETTAGRSGNENGYYTWPRFGFGGPLSRRVKEDLPAGIERAEDVLDLMGCEKGKAWWREHGSPIHLAFDVTRHSRSWNVFQRYLAQRVPRRRP
jgi:GNAT superfamily N-acetyltransferase